MAETLNLGTNGNWATKKESLLAYNSENNNFKPLPFNFTRNSSATRVNKEGLIEVVSNNEPRIDFKDSSEGSLLLEPSRTNFILKSDDVLTTYQSQNGSVSDASISINGFNNSIQIDYDTSNSLIYKRDFTPTIGTEYTISCFVQMSDNSAPIHTVDVNSGDFCLINNNTIVSESDIKTERLGSTNVYKVSAKKTATSTNNRFGIIKYSTQSSKGFKVTGFQLEQGSYATSYIPTSGGVVTRVAEECFNLPPTGIIGQTELTIFYQGIVERLGGSDGHALALSQSADASGSSRILLYRNSGNGNMYVYVQDSTTQFSTPLLVNSNPQINDKYAIAIKNNDLVIYCNGVKVAENTSGSVPISQYVYLNKWNNQINEKNIINDFKLYDTRLSNAELQALTQ